MSSHQCRAGTEKCAIASLGASSPPSTRGSSGSPVAGSDVAIVASSSSIAGIPSESQTQVPHHVPLVVVTLKPVGRAESGFAIQMSKRPGLEDEDAADLELAERGFGLASRGPSPSASLPPPHPVDLEPDSVCPSRLDAQDCPQASKTAK